MYNFPNELDLAIYLEKYDDLKKANFSPKDLQHHFEFYGKQEGRVTNSIESRHDFIPLIPKDETVLEIGPFYSPIVRGEKVKYFDVLNHNELVERAKELNYPVEQVPYIHFTDPKGDLSVINEKFDAVVSSHNIEHQPDLIDHLRKVENLLNAGGLFFCLIPDKRYCFDHFLPETTIADIVMRHKEKRNTHYLKSVIEHLALTTHNDPKRHWDGDHGPQYHDVANRVNAAIKEYEEANGNYIDVHAHYLTPNTFPEIIKGLNELHYTGLHVVRTYHTRRYQNEFFVIMEKAR